MAARLRAELVLPWLLAFTVAWPTAAVAQGSPERDALAREAFEAGRAAFEAGDYHRAAEDFEAAFHLSGRPTLLINTSRALKRLGRSEAAANALTRYLELAPNGEHRVAVEAELSVLHGEPATPTRPRPMPRVEATPNEAFDAETEASGRVYTWVFAAAALLFAGGAVGFYLDGAQRYDRLEAECGERGCSQSELGPLRTHLALGHVFLT
ncbi:MAG: hypothetical protein AAGF12_32110, partial [Myxococcota bacterium]